MFSRVKPLLRISVFQNVFRGCQSQASLEKFLQTVHESPPKQGYSLLFFDNEVQKLLRKISNVDLKKVFRPRPLGKELTTPVYKLLTTEELEAEMKKALKRAETLLQIPPLVNVNEDKYEILDSDTSLDGFDEHHSKHVFIDISYNKSNENRAVVVREPSGVLRTALRSERFRVNQIYNPTPGREIETPEMFFFEHLVDVIRRKDYEFILDRACSQFEPDEPMYHEVITITYEAINYCSDFPILHSTRHFGSLVFYLITHKKIDALLNYNILNDRIDDAFTLVKLYHIIHPQCKSAELSKGKTNDMEILKDFIKLDSNEENTLTRSLTVYKRKEQSQRDLSGGIREAHGV